jgi:membrane protease YdiL (CAAX protease family)
MTRVVVIWEALLCAIAFALNYARGAPLLPLRGTVAAGRLLAACGVALGLGLVTVALSRVLAERVEWLRRLETLIRRSLGPLEPREIVALAVLGPIGEEVFFRGMLQPALAGATRSPLASLAMATVLFAVMHLVPDREGASFWAWPAFAFALGLVLGALFLATGSILPPLVLHVTINAGNLPRIARPARR